MGSPWIKTAAALRDVRTWIVLFFLVRLYGITLPPLEVAHNWRQTLVAMVARNFLEVDANPLLPGVDIEGVRAGVTGMEFPLLAWLTHLPARLLGQAHWYGRLVNLMVSSLGVLAFHELARARFGRRVAYSAALVLLASLWFSYSRKVIPDTFATSLVLLGLWRGVRYLDRHGGVGELLSAGLLLCAGMLSKLPAGYLLPVVLLLALERHTAARRRLALGGAAAAATLVALGWYFLWVPELNRAHGGTIFVMGVGFGAGAAQLAARLPETLARFYETALKYAGFALFAFGLVCALRARDRRMLLVLGSCSLTFVAVALKAGTNFPHHTYYVLPYVPVLALGAGYGLAQLPRPGWRVGLLGVVLVEGVANQLQDFRIKPAYRALEHLDVTLDRVIARDELILVNGGGSSTPHYFAHRAGWSESNAQLADPRHVEALRARGLAAIVVLRRAIGSEVELPYERILETGDVVVYRP